MPLAVNDIVQVTLYGEKAGSRVLNVFHYQCTTAPSTGTPAENIQALLDHLWEIDTGVLQPLFTAVLPDNYVMRAVRGQRIAPTRTAYVEKLMIDTGDIDAEQLGTANLAWVIVKQSDTPGRRGKGTTHMLLPATSWMFQGELTNTGGADRQTLVNALDDQVTVAAGGVYVPVIYHPNFSPNFSRITHSTIMSEIRVMRRRTLRVGE